MQIHNYCVVKQLCHLASTWSHLFSNGTLLGVSLSQALLLLHGICPSALTELSVASADTTTGLCATLCCAACPVRGTVCVMYALYWTAV